MSLAALTEARLEPAAAPPDAGVAQAFDLAAIGVPPKLRRRLLHAATIHSVTDLKRIVDELDRACPTARPAVELFRDCIRRYDLQAVTDLAEQLGEADDREAAAALAPW